MNIPSAFAIFASAVFLSRGLVHLLDFFDTRDVDCLTIRHYYHNMAKSEKKVLYQAVAIVLGIILLDQIVKILVKTNLVLGESIELTSWFHIVFVENNGMAFGMEFFSKPVLSLFRIVAVGVIGFYLYRIILSGTYKRGFSFCIAMILAGAIGNIIDCLFYGVCFSSSVGQVAEFMPRDGGYAPFLEGRVVDMLYFPLVSSSWPEWLPIVGGDSFTFFAPVFNIADSFVCVGVFLTVALYRSCLIGEHAEENPISDNKQ